jgi:hypothetical protein
MSAIYLKLEDLQRRKSLDDRLPGMPNIGVQNPKYGGQQDHPYGIHRGVLLPLLP